MKVTKIETIEKTESETITNAVFINKESFSDIFETIDNFDNLAKNNNSITVTTTKNIVINDDSKSFSKVFKSFLEYILLFILSIAGFITFGTFHGSIAFLMLLLVMFLAFCVFVKFVDLFEATARFISTH